MSLNKKRIVLPVLILVAGVGAAVTLIRLRPPAETRPPAEFAPLVRVVTAKTEEYPLFVTTHGTVRPRTESSLVSEVPGRIIAVASSFAPGGFFEKGDVLVSIEPRDYELAVTQARGALAQARVTAEAEEKRAAIAKEEWSELGRGEGSPLTTRDLQLAAARATLASARAALEKAQLNLERTKIRAPYAGRVLTKTADVGQYIAPGAPIALIYAVDYAEVPLPVPDDQLAYLDIPLDSPASATGDRPLADVRLSADFAGARRTWTGSVVRVEGQIDPLSRMVSLVARVDDPYGRRSKGDRSPLAVGLFVEARITGRVVPEAIILPRGALRDDGRVLVVDGENRLRFRAVDILREEKEDVVITGGLAQGETVCVSNLDAVTDGMKVRTAVAVEETP